MMSVTTVVTVKNTHAKNAGSAYLGAVRGLTRNRMIASEEIERRADRQIPNRIEFTTQILEIHRAFAYHLSAFVSALCYVEQLQDDTKERR